MVGSRERDMNQEEFDRLLSEYSGGIISEADRNLLFQEALQNPERFEALAEEEHLREVFADPHFQQELLAELQPKAKPVVAWFRPWQLALGGTLASALLGTFIAWRNQPSARVSVTQSRPAAVGPVSPDGKSTPEAASTVQPEIAMRSQAPPSQEAAKDTEPQEAPSNTSDTIAENSRTEADAAPSSARIQTFSAQRAGRSAQAFTTTVDDTKVTIHIEQDGLLYVLALDGDESRVLENGSAAMAGTSTTVDPDGAKRLMITIIQNRIPDPTPARLRISGTTQTLIIP